MALSPGKPGASPMNQMLTEARTYMNMPNNIGLNSLKILVRRCIGEWCALWNERDIMRKFYGQLLLDYSKVDIARMLYDANCPLPLIVLMNDVELTRYMVYQGSPLNQYAWNVTALHVAIARNHVENVRFLLDAGANVNAKDLANGETPLCKYDLETEDTVDKCEILRLLLTRGASLHTTICDEREIVQSMLKRLLSRGGQMTVRTVLENIDLSTTYGPNDDTPLHLLMENVGANVQSEIQFLIDKGVDVNACNRFDKNPFAIAVSNGFTERVALLMENKANVSFVDVVRRTRMIRQLRRLSSSRVHGYNEVEEHYKKIFQLILKFDIDFIEMYHDNEHIREDSHMMLIKLALAYLVVDEYGIPFKPFPLSVQFYMDTYLNDYYTNCANYLEEIMPITIYGSVTVSKLLTRTYEQLIKYVRNDALLINFEQFVNNVISKDSYYRYILQKRLDKAYRIAALREEGVVAIYNICQIPAYVDVSVVERVATFLNVNDFRNLFAALDLMPNIPK